jgi:hypothetical protein
MKPGAVVFLGTTFPDDAAVPLTVVEYKASRYLSEDLYLQAVDM